MAFAPKTPERQPKAAAAAAAGKRVTTAVVTSVVAFAQLCSKQASRVSKKLRPSPGSPPKQPIIVLKEENTFRIPPSPRRLFATISNKAITLVHGRKRSSSEHNDDEDSMAAGSSDDWGDGGVWQRSILMGDKCQPLDFSGVIYYDSSGKQMSELPIRSPRASPLPSYLDRARA